MTTYRCKRCNYLFIEEEQKISFERVDDDYKCPRCRTSKKFFVEKLSPN